MFPHTSPALLFENAILLLFIFRVTPGVAVINEFPLSLIELVALMFTQELFVMQALATETVVGTYVPILKVPADRVVHKTFTIDAFTDEILTNKHVQLMHYYMMK